MDYLVIPYERHVVSDLDASCSARIWQYGGEEQAAGGQSALRSCTRAQRLEYETTDSQDCVIADSKYRV